MTKRIKKWDVREAHWTMPSFYLAIRYTPTDDPDDWVQEYWTTHGWVRYSGYDVLTDIPQIPGGRFRLFLLRLRTGMLFTTETAWPQRTISRPHPAGSDYDQAALQ